MPTRTRNGSTYPALSIGLVFLLLTLFLVYVSAKVIYIVRIENQTLSIIGLFKKKRIEYNEIKSINLFSIENFYWTAGAFTIGIRVELENGNKIVIADPFYMNIGLIKQALAENFKGKIKSLKITESQRLIQAELKGELLKFSGNPHTCINGIFLYIITIAFLIMILQHANLKWAHLFLLFPMAIFYFLFGSQLYYFLLSDKHLIVKNHFLFWIHKVYDINKIKVLSFEKPYHRSQGLRVTTIDFNSRLYCAGSLRDNQWNELKATFENLLIIFIE